MRTFVLKRFLKGILVVWFIWTLVFVLVRLTGDPVEWMLPDGAPQYIVDDLRESLGLDLPLWKQYLHSFASLLQGNSGTSYYYKRSVSSLFAERIWNTLSLGLPAFGLAVIVGIPLGVIAAVKSNTLVDRLATTLAIAGYTIPGFVLGILLILLLSVKWKIFPTGSTGSLAHHVLPTIVLATSPMANLARLTKGSLLDTLQKEYLDGARMRGTTEFVVIVKHALRNSLIPVVTALSIQLGSIISGAAVIETVFAWPGVGNLIVTAAKQRDFPTVQFGILLTAISMTLAYILVDIVYGYLDPRIRESYK